MAAISRCVLVALLTFAGTAHAQRAVPSGTGMVQLERRAAAGDYMFPAGYELAINAGGDVAFFSEQDGMRGLWRVRADGTALMMLREGDPSTGDGDMFFAVNAQTFHFTSDGDLITYVLFRTSPELWGIWHSEGVGAVNIVQRDMGVCPPNPPPNVTQVSTVVSNVGRPTLNAAGQMLFHSSCGPFRATGPTDVAYSPTSELAVSGHPLGLAMTMSSVGSGVMNSSGDVLFQGTASCSDPCMYPPGTQSFGAGLFLASGTSVRGIQFTGGDDVLGGAAAGEFITAMWNLHLNDRGAVAFLATTDQSADPGLFYAPPGAKPFLVARNGMDSVDPGATFSGLFPGEARGEESFWISDAGDMFFAATDDGPTTGGWFRYRHPDVLSLVVTASTDVAGVSGSAPLGVIRAITMSPDGRFAMVIRYDDVLKSGLVAQNDAREFVLVATDDSTYNDGTTTFDFRGSGFLLGPNGTDPQRISFNANGQLAFGSDAGVIVANVDEMLTPIQDGSHADVTVGPARAAGVEVTTVENFSAVEVDFSVRNTGSVPLVGYTVAVTFAPQVTIGALDGTNCTAQAGTEPGTAVGLSCMTQVALQPGEMDTVTLPFRPTAEGTLVLTLSGTAMDANVMMVPIAAQSLMLDVIAGEVADLRLTQAVNVPNGVAVTITNDGPDEARIASVKFEFEGPAEVLIMDECLAFIEDDGGVFCEPNRALGGGSLAPNESSTYILSPTTDVNPHIRLDARSVTARATSQTPDSNLANNTLSFDPATGGSTDGCAVSQARPPWVTFGLALALVVLFRGRRRS